MDEKQQKHSRAAIDLAVSRLGGVTATARALEVTRATIYNWTSGHWNISAENAVKLAELANLPKEDLRPDLWGDA